ESQRQHGDENANGSRDAKHSHHGRRPAFFHAAQVVNNRNCQCHTLRNASTTRNRIAPIAGITPLAAPTARVTPNPAKIALPGKKKKGNSPRVGSPPSVKILARPSPRAPPITAISRDSNRTNSR